MWFMLKCVVKWSSPVLGANIFPLAQPAIKPQAEASQHNRSPRVAANVDRDVEARKCQLSVYFTPFLHYPRDLADQVRQSSSLPS